MYRQCPYCGAYLDPCERCDCQDPDEDINKKRRCPPAPPQIPNKGDLYDHSIIS
jgi:hypothetical protein